MHTYTAALYVAQNHNSMHVLCHGWGPALPVYLTDVSLHTIGGAVDSS